MASSKTSRVDKNTGKQKKKSGKARPTISLDTTLRERKQLIELCSQIGALIIGQRHDRMNQAVEILQKQSSALLLTQHLEVWLPRFEEHYKALEKVVGKDLKLDGGNLVNDLRKKITDAGYSTVRDFLIKRVLPTVSYHGLLLFLNNQGGVALPKQVREEVVQRMNGINKVLGGACAAMVLQDSMGI
ncbi:MAG: hypothetical protein KDB68_09385 [Planctomycetes bacterium]|nr:hypothetical protein [Planctomycetota bacterium]MCA8936410.1 hypothetical protein [Planctomycetota bacterium]MCA8945314.1 hypothetical protein [Planctomycetota bacterium]